MGGAAGPSAARSERRHDPLADRWVLVSRGRDGRPWQGAREQRGRPTVPTHEASCHLCPGNRRAGGSRNPYYVGTHVFVNDFPAMRPADVPPVLRAPLAVGPASDRGRPARSLLRSEEVAGECRVLCFSDRHDLDLATLPRTALRGVVDLWADQVAELSATYPWVQVFENRGALMGASSPHPHGQVWASSSVPDGPATEDARQREHLLVHGSSLLGDYLSHELEVGERVIARTDGWVALVPFWATWPYELLIVCERDVRTLPEMDGPTRDGLVELLAATVPALDALHDEPMPYSMGWHGAPGGGDGSAEHWRLHAHVYPPMLRPGQRKFMVGYEMLAEAQRDLSPEDAAERLRAVLKRPHDRHATAAMGVR